MKRLNPSQLKAKETKDAKKLIKTMTNYFPTNQERLIMGECIKLGYRLLPMPQGVNGARNPNIKLTLESIGREPIESKKEPFNQKFLSYNIAKGYLAIWDRIKLTLPL